MRAGVAAELDPINFNNIRAGAGGAHWPLLAGKPGDPGNFELRLSHSAPDYATPTHRHSFEQVRWILEGKFTLGRGRYVRADEVGYWPEGVYYGGPAEGAYKHITLQLGGPSGSGVLTLEQLEEGRAELSRSGTFKDGIYTRVEADGRKRSRDSYEAIWEFFHKRPISYPTPPRFADVAVISPKTHRPRTLAPGVRVRHLGSFSECFTTLRMIEADAGAHLECGHERQPSILVLRSGTLAGNERSYPGVTAFHLEAGERQTFEVTEPIEMLEIDLPDLSHLTPPEAG